MFSRMVGILGAIYIGFMAEEAMFGTKGIEEYTVIIISILGAYSIFQTLAQVLVNLFKQEIR